MKTNEQLSKEASEETINASRKVADQKGVTLDVILDVQKDLLFNAKKTVIFKVKGKIDRRVKNNGYKVICQTTGLFPESLVAVEVEDLGVKQKAAAELHKLRGDYPSEKIDHTLKGNVGIQLSDEERRLAEAAVEAVKQMVLKGNQG